MQSFWSRIFIQVVALLLVNVWVAIALLVATGHAHFHWFLFWLWGEETLPTSTLASLETPRYWPWVIVFLCLGGVVLAMRRAIPQQRMEFVISLVALVELIVLGIHILTRILPGVSIMQGLVS